MKSHRNAKLAAPFAVAFAFLLLQPRSVLAHCDGVDGPVVKAAQKALETENLNIVLVWVQPKDEAIIREAFAKTLSVRKLNTESRRLADQYFFETVVRIHRAGEGAPYTGLKPAGRDLGPAIPAADKAIGSHSVEPLLKLITHEVQLGIQRRFQHVVAREGFAGNDVEAGREFVKAYVEFIHYVEQIYQLAHVPTTSHGSGGGATH
jgi:hypothetical protein